MVGMLQNMILVWCMASRLVRKRREALHCGSQWTSEEAKRSSTLREFAAVHGILSAVAPKLSNTRVRWITDNQNVACTLIAIESSKKHMLHALALKIFSLAVLYGIQLES